MKAGTLVRLGRGNLEFYGRDPWVEGRHSVQGMLHDSELLMFLGLHPEYPHMSQVMSPTLGVGYVQTAWIEPVEVT